MSGLDEALNSAVVGVTKRWTKQRKAEERSARARYRRREAFRPRAWTIKEAAEEVMEQAYMKASAGGTLPANARQIMYAARPYILEQTGKSDLDTRYFTQNLLPDFIAEEPELTSDWNVVYDARGHFREPHTKKTVPLGTLEVRRYRQAEPDADVKRLSPAYPTSGPHHRFGATLFIEKAGFDELFAAVKLAERYDLAIMSTKGMSVTAARTLVESLDHPLLVLHDFDQAGFSIIGTLRRSTRRYRFDSPPEVVDAGVRLNDIEELGLASEHQRLTHSPWKLKQNGATDADIDFLRTNARVELNAMTSEQLIALIERRLDEAGIKKVVPEADTLESAYRRAYRLSLLNDAIGAAEEDATEKADELHVPEDIAELVTTALEDDPSQPWDDAIAELVRKALEVSA